MRKKWREIEKKYSPVTTEGISGSGDMCSTLCSAKILA